MERPKIQVAIPQRRYQLGSYQAVVLGEIESGDERRYQYILALVKQDETQPGFYVTAEKNRACARPRRRLPVAGDDRRPERGAGVVRPLGRY